MAFLASSKIALDTTARPASPALCRAILALAIVAAFGAAVLVGQSGSTAAIRDAGDDLTSLLRMMALLKAGMAAAVIGGIAWRFGAPIGTLRLAGYVVACAAMAAGPPLIWSMAHVGVGAMVLHAGLLAALVLLWRDPAVGAKLTAAIARRRR